MEKKNIYMFHPVSTEVLWRYD